MNRSQGSRPRPGTLLLVVLAKWLAGYSEKT
jgi:hypothetical protein